MAPDRRKDSADAAPKARPASLQPVQLGAEPEKSIEPHRPVYVGEEGGRRRSLAGILWGEPDAPSDILEPVRKKRAREAAEKAPIRDAGKPVERAPDETWVRSTQRRQCSFPGVVRVLIPEISFQPRTLAVRIIDISRHGARMETRQISGDFAKILKSQPWHARLEAIVPTHGRTLIPGKVAWLDYDEETVSLLGIGFDKPCEFVDDFFVSGLNEDTSPAQLTLPPPILDAFPTVTHMNPFKFRGRARSAERVVIRTRRREYPAKVVDGRFEVEVPLEPDASNFVTVTSQKGHEASFPTPVCIVHKAGARDTITYKASALTDEMEIDEQAGRVALTVSGPPQRFFLVLDRIAKALEYAEDVTLTVEIQGDVARTSRKLSEAIDRPITGISED